MNRLGQIQTLLLDFLLPKDSGEREIESVTALKLSLKLSYQKVTAQDNTFYLFSYQDPLIKRMIWSVKYKGNKRTAGLFAEVAYDILLEQLGDLALFDNFDHPLLIPIPLSEKRLKERGFNQVELIARELCAIDKKNTFTLDVSSFKRIRNTPSQTTLQNKESRIKNLKGAFVVYNHSNIRGKSILLLDDVITTGATLGEARKTLTDAGAKQIFSIAIAH